MDRSHRPRYRPRRSQPTFAVEPPATRVGEAIKPTDPLEQIRFIRQTMESAGSFTLVPGIGQIAIGLTALLAAYFGGRASDAPRWLAIWVIEATIAMVIAAIAIVRKARRARQALVSGPAKK